MAANTTIALIYDDLVNAVKGIIEPEHIYLGCRPDVITEESPVSRFVVIDLPVHIKDMAAGNHKFHLTTIGVFHLFVKSKKNSTLNVNATSDFMEQLTGLFPISGEYVAATDPKVLTDGIDEYGYSFVTITFGLHTRR